MPVIKYSSSRVYWILSIWSKFVTAFLIKKWSFIAKYQNFLCSNAFPFTFLFYVHFSSLSKY